MEIANILKNYDAPTEKKSFSKITNERQLIIKDFMDMLNKDRDGNKYKPLTAGFISSKMAQSGLKDNYALKQFLGSCKQAKNPASYWWWALKAQK